MDNLDCALPPGKRVALRWLVVFAGGVALLSLAYFFVVEPLLVAACQQRGPSWLNRLFASSADRSVTDLVNVSRIYFSRSLLIFSIVLGATAAWRNRVPLRRRCNDFINEPGSAINLAVFRIAVFATLFFLVDVKTVKLFASFPIELQKLPSPGGNFLRLLPWNPEVALCATYLLKTICVLGMLGVGSRMCAFSAAGLAYYVLGFQQSFGKVNHFHHLIWFTLLLATSRCGDALSVDALLARRKSSWAERWWGPPPSLVYGLPLRFVWLLFGVIYFFPGFWKFWKCGYAWGLAENLQLQLFAQWKFLGDWRPVLRFDQFPVLLTLGGLGTFLFEMGFVFLVFTRRTRYIAVAAGLAFHTVTNMTLVISFWFLQGLYVAFIPWDRLFKLHMTSTIETKSLVVRPRQLVWMGTALLAVNIAFGIMRKEQGWPFACYPTFSYSVSEVQRGFELCRVAPSGAEQPVPMNLIEQAIQEQAARSLLTMTFADRLPEQKKLEAWQLASQSVLGNENCRLRLYQVSRSIFPDEANLPPREKKLLFEFQSPNAPLELTSAPSSGRNMK
jgi:hypothetical protein